MPDLLSHCTPSLNADDTEICASSYDYADLADKIDIDLENIRKRMLKTSFKSTPVNRNI